MRAWPEICQKITRNWDVIQLSVMPKLNSLKMLSVFDILRETLQTWIFIRKKILQIARN